MTRFFAVFASILLALNFSACGINDNKESAEVAPVSYPSGTAESTPFDTKSEQASTSSPAPSLPPSPDETDQITHNIINNKSITIIPQQDNRIIVTYPKHEINQGDIQPSDQNYTLTLTPGDYSDPQSAVTTFLYDLYMKQSLCFENIHRDITANTQTLPFVKTLYSMEDLVLNLGQIDVLVLPKLKYSSDGVPYVYQNSAAYKTTEDGVIRFGNSCENDASKQVTKGDFLINDMQLYFEANTCDTGSSEMQTYFEAIKKKNGDFIYRSLNIYQGTIQSLFITVSTVSDELMQAGFSQGVLQKDFVFTPLAKTPTLEASDEINSLTPLYYLFASEDGAMIVKPDEKNEYTETK
jgi:hypothetical protein